MKYLLAALAVAGLSSAAVAAQGTDDSTDESLRANAPARHAQAAEPVDRLIVGLRSDDAGSRAFASSADRARSAAQRNGLRVRAARALGPQMQVLELEAPVAGAALADTLARVAADPSVAFVEPDARVYPHAVPVDTLYAGQWYLQSAQVSAINAQAAWDLTTGSPGAVVAVLDTGVRFDHPDLLQGGRGGRLLPGYDFVGPDPGAGGFRVANDGDGWDANPSDPGDWITTANANGALFAGCGPSSSSWHGTRVAGMIGAIANNGQGIAGGTWGSWVLPVRVLGKCFGNNSDILQGMRWAAGLHIDGVPDNPYPAQVINMSLGATGACTAGYENVLEELNAAGVLVVASAGNGNGTPVEYPANCEGVAAIAGLRHVGTKVGYSSIGPTVALAAPGGNCVNVGSGPCLFTLDTTSNSGSTAPAASIYTDMFDANIGTSFAAPQVAAIAALMVSVNGNLTPPLLISRLRGAARPFPASAVEQCHVPVSKFDEQLECACTSTTCGAGMADAPGSVTAALRPIAAIALPASVSPGQPVTLDASGSRASCTRNVATYSWVALDGVTPIGGANTAIATLNAPASGSVALRLTVTDDEGATDVVQLSVASNGVLSEVPESLGSTACLTDIVPPDPGEFVDDGPVAVPVQTYSSSGGGWFGVGELLLLSFGVLARKSRREP